MNILIILVFLAACIIMDVLFNNSRFTEKWFRDSSGPKKKRDVPQNVTSGGVDEDGVVGEDDAVLLPAEKNEAFDCRERLVVVNGDTCIECREEDCNAPHENNKCFSKQINRVLTPARNNGEQCKYADGEVVYRPCLMCVDKNAFRTKTCHEHQFYTTNGEMINQTEQTERCAMDLVMAVKSHCDAIETEVRRDTSGPYSCTLASYMHFQSLLLRNDLASKYNGGIAAYDALKGVAKLITASEKRGEAGRMRIQPPRRRAYSEIFLYFTQYLRLSAANPTPPSSSPFSFSSPAPYGKEIATNIVVRSNDIRTVNLAASYASLAMLERVFGSENIIACRVDGDMAPLADRGGRINREIHARDPESTGVRFRMHPPWLAFRRSGADRRGYDAFLSAHRTGPGYGHMTSVRELVARLQPPINDRKLVNNTFFLSGIPSSGLFFHCPKGDTEFAAAIGTKPAPIAVTYILNDGTSRDTMPDRLLHVPGHPEWLCFRHNPLESTYTPAFRPLFPTRTRMAIDLVEFYNAEGEIRKETDGRARRTDELVLGLQDGSVLRYVLADLLEGPAKAVVLGDTTVVRRIELPLGVSVEFDLSWSGPRTGTGRDEPNRAHEDAYVLEMAGEFDVYFSTRKFTLRLLPRTVLWDKFDRFVEPTSSYEIETFPATGSAGCLVCADETKRSSNTLVCESAPCKKLYVRRDLGSLLGDPEKLDVLVEDKYRLHPRFEMWSVRPTGVLIHHESGFGNEFGTRKTEVLYARVQMSFGIKIYVMTNITDPRSGKSVVVEMRRPGTVEFEDPDTGMVRAVSGAEITDFLACLKDDAMVPTKRSTNILHTNETVVQIEAGVDRASRFIYLPIEETRYAPIRNGLVNAVPALDKSAVAAGVYHELPNRADDFTQRIGDVLHSVRVPRGTALVVHRGSQRSTISFDETRDIILPEGVFSSANTKNLFPLTDVNSLSLVILDSFFVFADDKGRFLRI
jgi:hypothetical protein